MYNSWAVQIILCGKKLKTTLERSLNLKIKLAYKYFVFDVIAI